MHQFINYIKPDRSSAEIYLYGTIGDTINGDYFAQELRYLDSEVGLINLHINSNGGEVFSAMAIVSAIRDAVTPVHVYIDGLAASAASLIAACGSRVYMQDYSFLMIHDPMFADESTMTDKKRKLLCKIKDALVSILSTRGMNEERVAELMAAETWFTAGEALENGLCDEVITSTNANLKNLSPTEMLNTIKLPNEMILTAQTAQILNVATDATSEIINSAIIALQNRAEAAENKVTEYENKAQAERKSQATVIIDEAIRTGKINAAGKAAYEQLFDKDFDTAKLAIAALPVRNSIADKLSGNQQSEELLNLTWDEAHRTNKLEQIRNSYPEHYQLLYNQKFSK